MFEIPETRKAKKPDNFVSPKLSGILRFDFRRLLRHRYINQNKRMITYNEFNARMSI